MKPKKDWVIIPNMHEAIIPIELWEKAQALANQRDYYKGSRMVDKGNNIFSGILFCGK